jgi:diacylglycerol O-acyltransferase
MSEWMSGADAAWLHMDRPTNRMIVNSVLWFESPVEWDRLLESVTERWLGSYPRLRQRVRESPIPFGPLALPRWADCPGFQLDRHIRRATLAAPGDDEALHRYVADQAPRPLDPEQPLWELHLLDEYRDGSAVLLRTHHAIADGLALMHLIEALSDAGASRAEPSPGAAAVDLRKAMDKGSAAVQRSRETLSDPGKLAEAVAVLRAQNAGWRRLGLIRQDRGTVLRSEVGITKTAQWTGAVPVAAVKAAAAEAGGSLNDLMLAVIAGGLARYLDERGDHPETLGAVVPFNIRPLDKPMSRRLGNRFGLVFVNLPTGRTSLRERIRATKLEMDAIKRSRQGWVTFAGLSTAGTMPARMDRAFIDRYAGMGSLIVTNVSGPRRALSFAGVEAAGLLFWVPATGPIGLGVSIVSYAGQLRLGLLADATLVPDPDRLLADLEHELADALTQTSASVDPEAQDPSRKPVPVPVPVPATATAVKETS